MKDEYVKNQKKQKKALEAYRKHNKKAIIWGAIGLLVAVFFPRSLALGLQGIFGDFLGGSIAFIAQWGIAAIGAAASIYNAIKAKFSVKKLKDLQDEEENTVDRMDLERAKYKEKTNALQNLLNRIKGKTNTNEVQNEYTNSLNNIEKENINPDLAKENKEKVYKK